MASAIVESVLRGYEAFNRGDDVVALEGFDPEIEWVGSDILPETGTYSGLEGVRRFWESWREVFDDFRIEIEETIEADEQVVVMARVRGRGRDSGAEVVTPSFAHVWTVRDGKAVRMEMLPNRVTALEAVGLESTTPREHLA